MIESTTQTGPDNSRDLALREIPQSNRRRTRQLRDQRIKTLGLMLLMKYLTHLCHSNRSRVYTRVRLRVWN